MTRSNEEIRASMEAEIAEIQAIKTVADAERFVVGGLLAMRECEIPEAEAAVILLGLLGLSGLRLPCGCPICLRVATFPDANFVEARICHAPAETH